MRRQPLPLGPHRGLCEHVPAIRRLPASPQGHPWVMTSCMPPLRGGRVSEADPPVAGGYNELEVTWEDNPGRGVRAGRRRRFAV